MKSRKAEGPRLRLSIEEVDMIRELRANNIDNVNDNSALTNHLNERGIDKDDVISVKHWQSASGDYRFSIVTKEDLSIKESLIFDKVNKFVEEYSPDYTEIKRKKQSDKLGCLLRSVSRYRCNLILWMYIEQSRVKRRRHESPLQNFARAH